MKSEEWKFAKGSNKYLVSSQGQVLSLCKHTPSLLIPHKMKNGYLIVTLCLDGKWVQKTVHRLVAETFLENPNNLPVVNHINENRADNRVENLEWCTQQYNVNYSLDKKFRKKYRKTNTGEHHIHFDKRGFYVISGGKKPIIRVSFEEAKEIRNGIFGDLYL